MKTLTKNPIIRAVQQPITCVVVLLLVALSNQLNAQSASSQFVPFVNFLVATSTANSSDYIGQPQDRVRDANAFEEMRQHILTMYVGAEVSHSFVKGNDYIDCIPIEQQPSIRLSQDKTVKLPPPGGVSDSDADFAAELDPFGNSTECEDGTIPMLRITLAQLSRFETLDDFFQKASGTAAQGRMTDKVAPSHKYARAYQLVKSKGASSVLNIWKPSVKQSDGQIFSLSQLWIVGGDDDKKQTVEGGWQNYPWKYGDEQSRLFIFWTANNYGQNGREPIQGCYNLDCPGFRQVSKSWSLGTPPKDGNKGTPPPPFDRYSVYGGAQYEFRMDWYFYDGDWWLGLAGTGNAGSGVPDSGLTWIGYYPGTLFGNGQMSMNATKIAFGGETAGTTSWGPMGSGCWPALGFKKAAYQAAIEYADEKGNFKNPSLIRFEPSPDLYKISNISVSDNAEWGTYFYFGGPGSAGVGATCN